MGFVYILKKKDFSPPTGWEHANFGYTIHFMGFIDTHLHYFLKGRTGTVPHYWVFLGFFI